jgi:pimeloyl-ACP methyl ester carboxylesterase
MKAEMIEVKRGLKIPVIVITRPHAKYTILYSHGNATDCGAMFPMYCMMAAFLQVNVVGYDYTGYGASMSQGIPATEKQTYKDITAVYNYCVSTKLVTDPATELVLYGQSVGSGPSCYLAVCKPIAGLVLHSPIMSGLRVITDSRMLSCFDIFPNITRIRGINAPVFIIHGKVSTTTSVLPARHLCPSRFLHCINLHVPRRTTWR